LKPAGRSGGVLAEAGDDGHLSRADLVAEQHEQEDQHQQPPVMRVMGFRCFIKRGERLSSFLGRFGGIRREDRAGEQVRPDGLLQVQHHDVLGVRGDEMYFFTPGRVAARASSRCAADKRSGRLNAASWLPNRARFREAVATFSN